jgi:hypothetical protein
MATLDSILEMIEEDFAIDQTNLGKEVLRSSDLFRKYLKLRAHERIRLSVLVAKLSELNREKQEYYKGDADAEVYREKPFDKFVKTDQALQRYLDADPDIIKHTLLIASQQEKIAVIEEAFKEIQRRGYNIKTSIDHEKFLAGAF